MATEARKSAYRKGYYAEWYAALSLMLKGYSIAARRFKTPVGEVDLIARKSNLVVFVEVKARKTEQLALNSITRQAQKRIDAAGEWWISQQPDGANLSWRFDVVVIVPHRWPIHFENVW